MSMEIESESLKQQFKQLEAQSAKRLQKMRDRKQAELTKQAASKAFGVDDNMELKLAEGPAQVPGVSEELVDHLNDQIRALTDENGRLYKLLSERDLEMRSLKKKINDRNSLNIAPDQLAGDAAAAKIVELSKKLREVNSELQRERTNSRQLALKTDELQRTILENKDQKGSAKNSKRSSYLFEETNTTEADVKAAQDKAREAERKATDLRNQVESLKKDVKLAHKALQREVGQEVSVQAILTGSSDWKGRQETISMLQGKLSELRSQLQDGTGSDVSTARSSAAERRHRQQLQKLDKERKEQNEKLQSDFQRLQEEHESLRSKNEAGRSRNKVLSTEVKSLKSQVQTLMKKGQHDDELIETLMNKQEQLKSLVQRTLEEKNESEAIERSKKKEAEVARQREGNTVHQLQSIVQQKQEQIDQLTSQLNQLKDKPEHQRRQVSALFDRSDSRVSVTSSRPDSRIGSSRPSSMSRLNDSPEVEFEVLPNQSLVISNREEDPPTARIETMSGRIRSRPPSITSSRPNSRSDRRPQSRDRPRSKGGRSSSVSMITGADQREYELRVAELTSLLRAAEVERDRLKELLQTTQQRADDMLESSTQSKTELQKQRHMNASLEKRLEKLQLSDRAAKGGRVVRDSLDEESSQQSLHELQTHLAIQTDENVALRSALQTTLSAKQNDMNTFQQIIEETRKVFIAGLRQFKSKS